ncbi:MAG: serine hydrolase domain-containing protein [Bacteroidota bacterium]
MSLLKLNSSAYFGAYIFCGCLCLSANVSGQNRLIDATDAFIIQQAEKYHVPGIAAVVVKDTAIVWSKGHGFADIATERKMTPHSIMNIASVSKTITATAVMQLWEAKKIDLDADINQYLNFTVRNPNFSNVPVTVRQLLTHTSSIADGNSLKLGFECTPPSKSLSEWLYHYFTEGGMYFDKGANFHDFAPGTGREYSNVGYGLLGLIVEEVTGLSFNQYVKAHIFAPLAMNDSGYFLNEVDTTRMVTPYLYLGPLQKNLGDSENQVLPHFNPYCRYGFWNYPDGLVRTSVSDLAKFTFAYMSNGYYQGKRLLKKETIDLMLSPQLSEEVNEDQDQGLGWFHSPSLHPAWYHGGSDPGVSTRMYVNKTDKIAVIVFQNVNEDNTFYIIKELYNKFKD